MSRTQTVNDIKESSNQLIAAIDDGGIDIADAVVQALHADLVATAQTSPGSPPSRDNITSLVYSISLRSWREGFNEGKRSQ